MPVATVDPTEYERFDLKHAPPDGYVMLRQLPYGLKLERRDKATRMRMIAEAPKGGRGAVGKQELEFETYSEWSQHFDFSYCIGDHNLTDPNGTPLDFTKPMTMKLLSPIIGSEIERYINQLNEDPDEETLEDFDKRSTTLSEISETQSKTESPAPIRELAKSE